MSAVIFSAPQAWGKTRNAKALRTEFGCKSIVDGWSPRDPIKADALHLTNAHGSMIVAHHTIDGTKVKLVTRGWNGGKA